MNPQNDTFDWKSHHRYYGATDWIDKPSIFAQQAINYFPKSGKLLELGAGQGQDSRFFAEHGYSVFSTDFEESVLAINRQKTSANLANSITLQIQDLTQDLAFKNEVFDVVYAHLSLHYFSDKQTKHIFNEIYRVLKPGGTFAFFVNSTSDPQYNTGDKIDTDYFLIDNLPKRFFTVTTAKLYAKDFTIQLVDADGETYKDTAKGVHNLIRYIGTKPN